MERDSQMHLRKGSKTSRRSTKDGGLFYKLITNCSHVGTLAIGWFVTLGSDCWSLISIGIKNRLINSY